MRARLLTMLLLAASAAAAQDSSPEFERQISVCRTYTACMRLLDSNSVFQSETIASQLAAKLQMLGGDRAKRELLRRATVDFSKAENSGELTYRRMGTAGEVLAKWDTWTAADLPVLRQGLLNDSTSQLAWPLAKIGTPEALRMFAEFAGPHDHHIAIVRFLGDPVMPHLLDALDAQIWSETAHLIHAVPELGMRAAPGWLALALDTQQLRTTRVKALRALGALGSSASAMHDSIAALRSGADVEVRRETFHALREMGNLGSAGELVEFCPRASDAFTTYRRDYNRPQVGEDAPEWSNCVAEIAWLGDESLPYGDNIADKFLSSQNGMDRADGASVLGFIGHRSSIPKLIALLDDPDWHVAYASARALRWLQASEAIPALQRVAATHWLPDLRAFANRVIASIEVPDRGTLKPDRGTRKDPFVSKIGHELFGTDKLAVHATVLSVVDACESEKWRWGTREFSWPKAVSETVPLRFQRLGYGERHSGFSSIPIARDGNLPQGDLVAVDAGEFGGGLSWQLRGAQREELYGGNATNLLAASDGAVALFSAGGITDHIPVDKADDQFVTLPNGEQLRHSDLIANYPLNDGFVLHIVRDRSGKWQLTEAARLIQGYSAMGAIGPDLYAAWSGGRVIVFDTHRILGLAECVSVG